MPVRFKGLSEYQRNFLWKKSYLSEACNPSVGQKHPWAGLRSDQLGITKEPSFISKRRVPYHDPQISKSLEWNGATPENEVVALLQPKAAEAPESQEVEGASQGRVLSLEVPRVPKRTRSHSADSRAEGASDVGDSNEGVKAEHLPLTENVELEHSTKFSSENVDNRVYHSKSRFVPQFKSNSVIHETEYKRNFKGLSPVKEPVVRQELKENGIPETVSPEKKCNKADDPLRLEPEMASKDSNQPKKKLTPWRHQRLGKVNSEYRAKFLSPAQYFYKAGAWTCVKENMPDQGSLNAMWYAEVKELREKAEFYRKRVQGTHFSRDHLNQIVSDNNRCWDVSSTTSSEGTVSSNIRALDLAGDPTGPKTLKECPEEKGHVLEEPQTKSMEQLGMSGAPTVPVRRRLAWDAEDTGDNEQEEPRGEKEAEEVDVREQEEEEAKEEQVCTGHLEKLDTQEKSQADKMREGSDSSSESSATGGRLPTPKLRALGGIQRTHHDLTTPAVGGAVLVSPSKVKPPAPEQRKRVAPQDGLETPKKDCTKKENRAISLLTSPAAGIKTVDPLPLREDTEISIPKFTEATLPVSAVPESPANNPGQPSSLPHAPSYWHPSRRIQGSLRHPEFQHNVGKTRMRNLQLHQHEAFDDEDADRWSDISARSAASSLRAFQTLARARRRKEDFWGK
ncbi:nuclear protein MDM1 isoform X3 [Ochotona curzoniae]|uniref:nuclear protein MDM1 isoform X3 n=1 Tax=Ochotona curzoniae TaxID=130825 RepID=UPI001B349130|nr:nuclear protein MDM1 isoform X3 [Ochotona curzoniae]